jgi:hypothetical protein
MIRLGDLPFCKKPVYGGHIPNTYVTIQFSNTRSVHAGIDRVTEDSLHLRNCIEITQNEYHEIYSPDLTNLILSKDTMVSDKTCEISFFDWQCEMQLQYYYWRTQKRLNTEGEPYHETNLEIERLQEDDPGSVRIQELIKLNGEIMAKALNPGEDNPRLATTER